jgi:hypothetical protein
MGYAEAIEQQAEQLHYWNSGRGLIQARTMRAANPNIWPDESDAYRLRTMVAGTLAIAEPYYIAPAICDLLFAAADSLPDATLSADLLPAREGFIFWGKPIPMPPLPAEYGGGDLRTTVWSDGHWHSDKTAHITGCIVLDFNDMAEHPIPRLAAQTYWPYGDSLRGWESRGWETERTEAYRRNQFGIGASSNVSGVR